MYILGEIEYTRKSDGKMVYSDICQDPAIPMREFFEELLQKADMTKPWKLEGYGIRIKVLG
jgi:hypothetical protein